MSDRAAFMRQLGISDDDMKIDDPAPPRPREGSERHIKFASHCEYMDNPKAKRGTDLAAAAPAPTQSGSRADFLRSLGIDNAEPPEATVSTPHASKEFLKRPVQESEDASRSRYAMPAAPPDITLGQRRSSTKLESQSSSSIPDDDGLSATQLKDQGNKAFDAGDFRKAIRLYGRAIEKDPNNAALYSNRSAAYLQGGKQMGMDTRTMALRDADKVIELRPTWFKGYSRKGDALFKLEAFAEAAATYTQGLHYDEGNINLMQSLQEAKKAAAGVSRKDRSAVSLAMEEADRAMDRRSVFDMVDELRESQRRTNASATSGNDYRVRELERFRTSKEMPKPAPKGQAPSSYTSMSSVDSDEPPKPSQSKAHIPPRSERMEIPQEFTSSAAAAYQQELLERYRRKKNAK